MKLQDARRDQYRRLAHEQGYRSRAAYKLKELNQSYRIIGPGFYVLDLGCAPGGWTQMAVKLSGNQGKVDTSYVEEVPGAHIVRRDIADDGLADDVISYFGRKVNAVVCDLSPKVSGNWSVDHARQISLNYDCAGIMGSVLARRGNAVFKVFDGQYSAEFGSYIKTQFAKMQRTKPKASRKQSSELYYVCLGFVGS